MFGRGSYYIHLHSAKQSIQDRLDALDTDVTGLGTIVGVAEGEIAAIQSQLVGLAVASMAYSVFSFANAAATLVSSILLSSQLSQYLPLSGDTLTGSLNSGLGSFISLTDYGNNLNTIQTFSMLPI